MLPPFRKRPVNFSSRLPMAFYILRIACFAVTMFFTFYVRVVPVAIVGWICLGMLLLKDFS